MIKESLSRLVQTQTPIFVAIGVVLIVHIIFFLSVNFQISSQEIIRHPSLNFLGSFLASSDTQPHEQQPALNSTNKYTFQTPATNTRILMKEISRPHLFLSRSLPASTKTVLPDSRAKVQEHQEQAPDAEKPSEPFDHLPLKLPDYDNLRF